MEGMAKDLVRSGFFKDLVRSGYFEGKPPEQAGQSAAQRAPDILEKPERERDIRSPQKRFPTGSKKTFSEHYNTLSPPLSGGHDPSETTVKKRTMTDIYSDELYSPNFAITNTPPTQSRVQTHSPASDIFSQRLNAANSQHLSASHSPNPSAISQGRSPFGLSNTDYPSSAHGISMAGLTQGKATQDSQYIQPQQMPRGRVDEPKTLEIISPKDALLDFDDNNPTALDSFLFASEPGTPTFQSKSIEPHLTLQDESPPPTKGPAQLSRWPEHGLSVAAHEPVMSDGQRSASPSAAMAVSGHPIIQSGSGQERHTGQHDERPLNPLETISVARDTAKTSNVDAFISDDYFNEHFLAGHDGAIIRWLEKSP